jgi:hypothetical protein
MAAGLVKRMFIDKEAQLGVIRTEYMACYCINRPYSTVDIF